MIDNVSIPALTDDENRTANKLIDGLVARMPRNLERASFYDGKRAVSQVGSVIPPQYMRMANALGWVAKGVDGLARRCNIDEFVWTDGDLGSTGFYEFADENFLLADLTQARTDSLINGVSYVVTTHGAEGEPGALVHVRDGLRAFGSWNQRKRRLDDLLTVGRVDEVGVTAGRVVACGA